VEPLSLASAFVGRVFELDAVATRLRSAPLVLLGAPGVGKSRLAQQLVERHTGRAIFLSLQHCVKPSQLVYAVADALSASLPLATPPDEACERVGKLLARAAAKSPVLLVFDNCEQLSDACAPLLMQWLGIASSDLQLLLTSRRRLNLDCMHLELSALSLAARPALAKRSEAVELLIERAAETARLRPEPGDYESLEHIAHALQGLPLSLELAAASLRVLSPKQLLSYMSSEVLDAAGGLGAGPGGLHASVLRSLGLLPPDALRCLEALSVFRGSASLEALISVLSLPAARTVGALSTLKDHSLVQTVRAGDEFRYCMLGSIRECLDKTLSKKKRYAYADLHLQYFGALSAKVPSTSKHQIENMIIALDRAVASKSPRQAAALALALSAQETGVPYAEASELLARAIALTKGEDQVHLLLRRGTCLRFLGELEEALADLKLAERWAKQLGAAKLQAEALCGVGNTVARSAQWALARAYFKQALKLHPSDSFRAEVLPMLANSYAGEDDQLHFEPLARESLAVSDAHGTPFGQARARVILAAMLLESGKLEEARNAILTGLARFEALGSEHWQGVALTILGRVHQELTDHAAALIACSSKAGRSRSLSAHCSQRHVLELALPRVARARRSA
jgi:tetratricopeptide (TPR) repeat protein